MYLTAVDIWFERNVLRCIFGAKDENEIWRKRYNYKLYEIFNESNTVNYIKVKRVAWVGHLMCMNDNRTINKTIKNKLDGVKKSWKTENAMERWC